MRSPVTPTIRHRNPPPLLWLFLAGSAINTIKDSQGRPDPRIGLEAMLQTIDVHRSGEMRGVPIDRHLEALYDLSRRKNLGELAEALRQRYPSLTD